MLKRFVFFLFVLPALLFGEKVKTFYGDLEVTEPVLLELIKSPTFQRLKKIHQYGISYYAGTHTEEYTRYDHSIGVFAVLRLKGRSLQEQIAGLLHDVSHTVFSHVGDWVYAKQNQEKDHQNSIHATFIEKCELGEILKKYSYTAESILPLKSNFPALESSVPDLCADRIEYNLQGAYHRGYITQKEAREVLDALEYRDGQWIAKVSTPLINVVKYSYFMSQDCWGSPDNDVRSHWLADALIRGLELNLISEDDIHYSTDEIVWNTLLASKDPVIVERIGAVNEKKPIFTILPSKDGADKVIISKFRGIDPLVEHQGKVVRLSSINTEVAQAFAQGKKNHESGWAIRFVDHVPKKRYKEHFDSSWNGSSPLINELNQEYPPDYCALLEEAYGPSLMSEGGIESIHHLFEGIDLDSKVALEIGSGLGGAAFTLADRHSMRITGLEINPWMSEEATKRTPNHLKESVDFICSKSRTKLPFPDNHFDIVFSKGVLTHLDAKGPLFKEINRVLKPGGKVVINDWLSPTQGKWGKHLTKLIELEGLTLFAHTEEHYLSLLEKYGFSVLSHRDESTTYQKYNQEIANTLKSPKRFADASKKWGATLIKDSISGYEAIADAMGTGELRVITFVAERRDSK